MTWLSDPSSGLDDVLNIVRPIMICLLQREFFVKDSDHLFEMEGNG